MNALVPCASCHRHVREEETGCPFCGAAIVLDDSARPSEPGSRLGRAALFAFRTSTALALGASLGACGDDRPPPSSAPEPTIVMQPYGAPPITPPEPPPPPPPSSDVDANVAAAPPPPESEQTQQDPPPRRRPRPPDYGSVHALYGVAPAYGGSPGRGGLGDLE